MTLSDAISAVETTQSAYTNAAATTTNDQSAASAIQAKLDAANAQIAVDQQAQNDAAVAFNGALDAAVAVFQSAKIPVAAPPVPAA